jgi:hypothetical protein
MTAAEFAPIVERLSALWPPRLQGPAIDAYFEVLEDLPSSWVREAVRLIAQTSREHRPPAGLIRDTALRLGGSDPGLASASGADPMPAQERRIVSAALWRQMSPEHRRRAELLKPLAGRLKLVQMLALMRLPAGEFDSAVARLEAEWQGELRS